MKKINLSLVPSSQKIRKELSSGEISSPESIDYKTKEAVEGGIMCPRIFGHYNDKKRTNMGHIELNWKMVHPIFLST